MTGREYSDDHMWVGVWNNVVIQAYRGQVDLLQVQQAVAATARLRQTHPQFLTFALIIPGEVPKLSQEARAFVQEYQKTLEARAVATAQVVAGTGMWAATVRAMLVGINLLSAVPTKVFGDTTAAARWLREQSNERWEWEGLVVSVGEALAEWQPARGP